MIQELQAVLAGGGSHLGDLLWWTLSDAAVDRTTLEAHWASANLAPDLLPEAPTANKLLKTAIRESSVGLHDRLVRLPKGTEQEIVFAVVEREGKLPARWRRATTSRAAVRPAAWPLPPVPGCPDPHPPTGAPSPS
jgi:hypothetical protein